jgi:hypothetical protein
MVVTLIVAMQPGRRYPALYQLFLPQTHVGNLIAVLYGLGLGLLLTRKKFERRDDVYLFLLIIYALVCLLGVMSNMVFFVHLLLPLSTALCFTAFLDLITWKESYAPITVGWFAAALGAVLNRSLFHVTDLSAESGLSVNRMMVSLDVFLRGAVAAVLAGDTLHLIAIGWFAVCVGYVLYTLRARIRAKGRLEFSRTRAFVFFLSCVLSSVLGIGAIVVGGCNGPADFKDYAWAMHYLHPTFLLPIFGFPFLLGWVVSASNISLTLAERLGMYRWRHMFRPGL